MPAQQFWALTLYDPDTCAFIRDMPRTGLDSYDQKMQKNADGSVELYIGPRPPAGKEANWIQTASWRSWFPAFRLYGPGKTFFDKTWKLPAMEWRFFGARFAPKNSTRASQLQSEYFVPRQHTIGAIPGMLHALDPHLMISEIRTIAADDLRMSPCYEQPSLALHFTWKQGWPAVRQLLPLIGKELAIFHPRPHWGKLFTVVAIQLHKASRICRTGQEVRSAGEISE